MPRKKGAGQGKWKSKKTGKFVRSHYAKRNPKNVERVEDSVAEPENESLLEKLDAAYTKGFDDAEEIVCNQMADLLERSERERDELETRIEQLEEALKHYADKNNWTNDYNDGYCDVELTLWCDINDNGTFPGGPDLALVALSGEHLKKEEGEDG